MGMVVMTYKVNPDSDLQDVDTDAIAETIATLRNDNSVSYTHLTLPTKA